VTREQLALFADNDAGRVLKTQDLNLLLKNFEAIAEAGGAVGALRGAVLDLAVRGLLVSQDNSEEPARDFLKRVAGVASVGPKSEPGSRFEIPPTWEWATLGRVCAYIQRGKSPSYVDISAIPVVSQKCVQWEGFLLDRARFIDPESLSSYGDERFLRTGDLLWNSTGHGTVGRAAIYKSDVRYRKVVADSHVTVLRPSLVDPHYIWCWLASPTVQSTIDNLVSGSTKQTELATSTVVAHEIPVPPLAEQKRIVAKVDELMRMLDDLEAKQAKKREVQGRLRTAALDALTSAEGPEEFEAAWKRVGGSWEVLFAYPDDVLVLRKVILEAAMRGRLCQPAEGSSCDELIEQARRQVQRHDASRRATRRELAAPIDPTEHPSIPSHWRAVRWREIGAWQNGRAFPSTEYVSDGVKLLRPGNLHASGRLSWTEQNTRCLPERYAETYPEFLVGEGELVMNLTAQSLKDEFLGRVCLTSAPERCLLNQRIARLWPFAITPEFGMWFFRCAFFRRYVDGLNQGTLIQHMFTSQLDQAIVFVPPLAEQRRIVAKVDHLMKLCDDLEAKLKAKEQTASKLVEAVVKSLVA
jgi:type I restriction enzyme, S subunit